MTVSNKSGNSLKDYRTPSSSILFVLEHASGVARLKNWDRNIAAEILNHAAKLVENVIAPSEPKLDTEPPSIDAGRVKVSPLLKASVKRFAADGWYGLNVPEAWAGHGQPGALGNALLEMVAGASLNVCMAISCPPATLKFLLSEGSEDQKARYIPGLMSGEYGATIVLSEPQAGSDLRLIRSKATRIDDQFWSLNGGKIFCSHADHDMAPNILHCILARTPDVPEGTKGLSLFLVPAVLPDGTRNSISVTHLEEKMGLHASPTCQVTFDGAKAEIVGECGEGLKRMFTMMNAMRLDVATQAIGLCQIAYQRSSAYAAERRQGRSLNRTSNADDPLLINRHGDIKRMLLTQEALTLGCRAMVYRTAVDLELDQKSPLAAFMLPVCKVFASDAANEAADMAIQIHGGYGYVKEYQVEQIARDARITRIYEGANGLHSTNLTANLQKPKGQLDARAFEQDIRSVVASSTPEIGNSLLKNLDFWCQARDLLSQRRDPGMVAYDFMKLTGLIAFASAWCRLESAADLAADPGQIRKLAVFVRNRMLPEAEFLLNQIRLDPAPGS